MAQPLRIHLIAPSREEPVHYRNTVSMSPPLGLAVLAGLTPPDAEVWITDENITPAEPQQAADLVGITATTHTAPRAYQIADAYRARGQSVVLGGMHPSALPEEALQHADAVVVGEAEDVWPRLLDDLKAGHLQPIYRGNGYPDLAGRPIPRRDLFRRESYLLPDSIFTTRGCPFGCSFCTVTSFFGGTYRSRPVGEIVSEVEGMGGPLLFFLDDNVAAHAGRAKQLFRALVPYKLKWVGQASITIAKDEGVLAAAVESGCVALLIGIESLNPGALGAVGKRMNVVEEYEEAIRRIHAHGIGVFGAFLFGLDQDTEDVFDLTVRFARKVRLEGAQFNLLTPYPGTPIHSALEREGRILTRDWAEYRSDRVVFEPRLLSVSRLKQGHDWAWREFYSMGSIWERIGLRHPNLLLMWALNLNFRGDVISRKLLESLIDWGSRSLRNRPVPSATSLGSRPGPSSSSG